MVNSRKLCIFLASDAPFKFDFSRLHDLRMDFVLICMSELYESMAMHQKMNFMEVYFTKKLTLPYLVSIVNSLKNDKKWSDVVIVSCDEDVILLGPELREHYGLLGDSLDSIKTFSQKEIMKEKLKGSNVRIPRYAIFNTSEYLRDSKSYVQALVDYIKLPIFCKPTHSAGSREAVVFYTEIDLINWCEDHINSNIQYEFDEFITGEMYHCDSIIQDGKIVRSFVCKYTIPCYEYKAGKMLGSVLMPEDCELFSKICDFNNSILKTLEVPSRMVTHLELYRTPNDELVFVEIHARAPGSYIPYIYEKSYGVNLQEIYLRLQIDPEYDFQRESIALDYYSAECAFPTRPGVVHSLNNVPKLNSKYYIEWHIQPGQAVDFPSDIVFTACRILLWNKDYDKVTEDVSTLMNFIPYN